MNFIVCSIEEILIFLVSVSNLVMEVRKILSKYPLQTFASETKKTTGTWGVNTTIEMIQQLFSG